MRPQSPGARVPSIPSRPASGSDAPTSDAPALTTEPGQVLEQRLRTRHHYLLQSIACGTAVCSLLLVPAALFPIVDFARLIPVLAGALSAFAALALNQWWRVYAAAAVLVGGVTAAIVGSVVAAGYTLGGLDMSEVRQIDLLVVPIVIAVVIMKPVGVYFFAAASSAATVAMILLLPRTPALQAYMSQHYLYAKGSVYDVIILPLVIQWIVLIVGRFSVVSARRDLRGAIRADELQAANERIVAQRQEMEHQRQRVQEGIAQMQQVYAAVSRGDAQARVRAPNDAVLPLALSFNRLLDRQSRLAQQARDYHNLMTAIGVLEAYLYAVRAGQHAVPPARTGTALDGVLVACDALVHTAAMPQRSQGAAELSRPVPSVPHVPMDPQADSGPLATWTMRGAPASPPAHSTPSSPSEEETNWNASLPPWLRRARPDMLVLNQQTHAGMVPSAPYLSPCPPSPLGKGVGAERRG